MRFFARGFASSGPIAALISICILGILTTATAIAADTATSTISAATSTEAATTSSNLATGDASVQLVATSTTATTTAAQTGASVATSTATTTPRVALDCTTAYVADLYNTPSGHLDAGYTLSTTTGAGILAARIGTQAWADCQDPEGNKYEFKLSSDQYAALGVPNMPMPEEFADPSNKLGAIISPSSDAPDAGASIVENTAALAATTTESDASIENAATSTTDQTVVPSEEPNATSTANTSSATTSTIDQAPTNDNGDVSTTSPSSTSSSQVSSTTAATTTTQ